jgi:hypothetical protein
MVKSCSGERLKMSILVHILLNKEPSLVAGLCQTAFDRKRNPPDSGGILSKYRNSCPQEFLRKIPVKSKKPEFLRPLQNHVPVKNSSGKHRKKRNPQESCQERIFGPKK